MIIMPSSYTRGVRASRNGDNNCQENGRRKSNEPKNERRGEEPPKRPKPRANHPSQGTEDAHNKGKDQADRQHGEHDRRQDNGKG